MNTSAVASPLGIHALVRAGNTSDAEIDRIVSGSADTGYDLVELSLHDMGSMDLSRTRALVESRRLRLACSRGLAFDADVSSDDPAVVARGAELLSQSLRATAELGGTIFTGALYSALGKYGRALTPRGRDNAVGVIRELAADAAGLGVDLGLEVCNRYETNVVNTARDALRLADDIGADNVMIHLDTYHMNIEEDDLVRPVLEAGDRLGYVHVGENHRGYLGSGHLDLTGFLHALGNIGYAGPITFESFSSSVVARGLSDDLAIWRDLWDDGEDLAKHAHRYLTTHLAVNTAHG